jgi:formiminoglutamase
VAQLITTDVARAIVDLNRAENDFRPDGVVKTHTCWKVPVYDPFPPWRLVDELLDRYYRPFHQQLSAPASAVRLGVDCHTMAAVGPPIGPDAGAARPSVCLGDARGTTLPFGWMRKLAKCFRQAFGPDVAVNEPFSGGYITRRHGRERPWVQVELSRAPFLSDDGKRWRVLQALTEFCRSVL